MCGRFLLAAALIGVAVAPLAAEPLVSRPEAKERVVQNEFEALFRQAMDPSAAPAIPAITALLAKVSNDHQRAVILSIRGAAYLGVNDPGAAARDFDKAASLTPDHVPDQIRFSAGLVHKNFGQSAIALDHLLASAPELVTKEIDVSSMWFYLDGKGVPKRQLDDQRIALAKLNYGADQGVAIRLRAMLALIERGQTAEAAALAPSIDDVDSLNYALVDRRYSVIWPQLEQVAGPHMATLSAASLKRTQAAFDADPTVDNRRMLMTALTGAGRLEESAKLAEAIGDTPEKLAAMNEAEAWVIDTQANLLYKLKRGKEADRRYDELIRARSDQPWIVSMVINRAEYLSSTGDFAAGDKLVAFTEANGQSFGSPYAKQLIRRIKLCTAIGLGQQDKIAPLLTDLKVHETDSTVVTFEGLSCAGDGAGAEAIVLKLFADPGRLSQLAILLQRTPIDQRDPSVWTKYWAAMRQRPAVDTAFLKFARDMPDMLRAP